jgi:elongator complex protein 3
MELTTETRTTNPLHHLLTWVIPKVHPWIRLNRIIRDNPERNIIGGLNKSHYRNEIEDYLEETGRVSQDIRYREIKEREFDENSVRLISRKYQASGGLEYFLSMEDTKNNYLLGFLRLRIPKKLEHYLPELSYSALIRELHVYGWMVPQGEKKSLVQHRGYGKLLLQEAEKLAKKHQFEKIAVISGEGVREYYQKQGYFTEGTFEVKNL